MVTMNLLHVYTLVIRKHGETLIQEEGGPGTRISRGRPRGRFDESGSQMLLYTDTATSRRGSTLKPSAHEIREEWRAEGLPEEDIQAGVEFWLELHRLAAEDAALARANTLFDDAKKEPWFAQTFGEWVPIESAWWQRHVANMQLEPADDAAHLDIPVLWFLAEKDQNVPYTASLAALQKAKDANTQLELITVQDSPHSFLLPAANDKVRYTQNYWPVMSAWLQDRGIVPAEHAQPVNERGGSHSGRGRPQPAE